MKIRPWTAQMFQADGRSDGQTGMTNLKVSFRHFENAPQKEDV